MKLFSDINLREIFLLTDKNAARIEVRTENINADKAGANLDTSFEFSQTLTR